MKPPIRLGVVVLADAIAIGLLYPDWRSIAAGARDPGAWIEDAGADTVLSTLAATALWVISVWLGLAFLAVLAGALPGTTGAIARSVANVAVPAIVHRAIAGVLGLGILAAPAVGLASPVPSPTHSASSVSTATMSPLPAPSWPTASAGSARPTVETPGRPSNTEPLPPPKRGAEPPWHHRRQPPAPNASVVVHPGDSLWVIAAARLGQPASDDQIAVAWPSWYAANQVEIGSDPNLIRPGQVLHAPRPAEGS